MLGSLGSDEGVPWRSAKLQIVLASSLIGVMGVSLISPVLPELRGVFGVSDSQVGLVITMYTLPGIVITPFVGLVADRLGRRRVVVPLLLIFGVAGAGIVFAESFLQVLVLRLAQGVGASALVTLSVTLIGDYYEGTQRDATIGINGSVISVGAAVYPLIGGALAVVRWSAPFGFFGVAVLVGIAAVFVLEEPAAQREISVSAYLAKMKKAVMLPEAIGIYIAVFFAFFLFYGAVLTALPLVLSDAYGLPASRIGVLLSMVSVASASVSSQYGRMSQWLPATQLIALGFVSYGLGLVGVWLAPSPVAIGGALLVFGIGFGLVMPSLDTTLVGLVSGQLRAGMMGVRTSMLRLGQTLGPIAFTMTAEQAFRGSVVGYRWLVLIAGSVAVGSGVVVLLVLRGNRFGSET